MHELGLVGLRGELEATLGASIKRARALTGGSINQAWSVTLADGRAVFVKANARAAADMFAAEQRGLEWLRAGVSAQAPLRIPEVLARDAGGRFLVLELLEPGPACAHFDETLGRGLAALHQSGASLPGFGLDHDNYVGSLAQQNTAASKEGDWPSFYRARRLEPLLEQASRRGLSDRALRRGFDRLYARLGELCGPAEPPARLHGDLWAGNLHRDAAGWPALIDPAVYAGHREMDLAMMRLFGGFSQRVFAAYEEVWPLAPGAGERVDLYQLYPLLVHLLLFGASYRGAIEAALGRLDR